MAETCKLKDTLKEEYNNGNITFDEYTERLVSLVVRIILYSPFFVEVGLVSNKFSTLFPHYYFQNNEDNNKLFDRTKRNEQYLAYKSGHQEGKTVDSIKTVERYVKNAIYPKIKFFSDDDIDYDQPDFTGAGAGPKKQAVAICECLLKYLGKTDYSIHKKVLWWVSYRKVIKAKISRLRQADVRSVQVSFMEGNFPCVVTVVYLFVKTVQFVLHVLHYFSVTSFLQEKYIIGTMNCAHDLIFFPSFPFTQEYHCSRGYK